MAEKHSPISAKEAQELLERYTSTGEVLNRLPVMLAQMARDIPRIFQEWERLRSEVEKYKGQLTTALERTRAAQKRAKALEEALRPFASYRFNPGEEEADHVGVVVSVEHISKAKEVLGLDS